MEYNFRNQVDEYTNPKFAEIGDFCVWTGPNGQLNTSVVVPSHNQYGKRWLSDSLDSYFKYWLITDTNNPKFPWAIENLKDNRCFRYKDGDSGITFRKRKPEEPEETKAYVPIPDTVLNLGIF